MILVKNSINHRITFIVGQVIPNNAPVKIHYIKPDKTRGFFTAEITNAASGTLSFLINSPNDIDQRGDWNFYASVDFGGGHPTFTDTIIVSVKDQGEI